MRDLQAWVKQNKVISIKRPNQTLAGTTAGPIDKPKTRNHAKPTAPVGRIHGDDNTIVGHSEYGSVDGSGNTIVGPTDANGNTILNRGGTAIGHGATADPTSIAIGAGAHAGDTGPAVTQTMTNSPGGMQAGHDLTVIGNIPAPDRVLLPNDENTAIDLLKTVAPRGMVYFIKIPTDSPENSEISRFQRILENVFARGGWDRWPDRETHFGSFTTMDETYTSHGEGIGCTPAKGHEKEAAVAMKALEILKYPCRGRSANDFESYPRHGDFVIYISVGTRLVRKE
jgi:hypothetical protein